MKDLQKLREIFFSNQNTIMSAPNGRVYTGEWAEVVVGIGKNHTATITMPADALEELIRLTETPNEAIQQLGEE